MNQKEFLTKLQGDKVMQNKLRKSAQRSDGDFYFSLGEIFGWLNINGWESESFIDKVCKICECEF